MRCFAFGRIVYLLAVLRHVGGGCFCCAPSLRLEVLLFAWEVLELRGMKAGLWWHVAQQIDGGVGKPMLTGRALRATTTVYVRVRAKKIQARVYVMWYQYIHQRYLVSV